MIGGVLEPIDSGPYVLQVLPAGMANPKYSLLVAGFLGGQRRIRLCDSTVPDIYAPQGHGGIIRDMCTYSQTTMQATCAMLAAADDPPAFAHGLANTLNCDHPRGRIRLDTPHVDPICKHCGKPASDWAAKGCGHCDRRC